MSITDIIRDYALAQVGSPYVYGATAQRCTPDYRRARQRQYPAFEASIRTYCPVLSGKQTTCAGCKYDGRLAFDCAQLTRYAARAAGLTLPSGSTSQYKNADWAVRDTIDKLPPGQVAFLYRVTAEGKIPHTGIALGDGTVVDARGHSAGVVRNPLGSYRWTHYALLPGMENGGDIVMPTLMRGSEGPAVKTLQQSLIKLNYDLGRWGADGKFGAQTEAAVKDFQKNASLPVTGLWSEDDEERLAIVLADEVTQPIQPPNPPVDILALLDEHARLSERQAAIIRAVREAIS